MQMKYKFDGKRCNSNQKWNKINVDASAENITHVKKIIFRIMLDVAAKMINV